MMRRRSGQAVNLSTSLDAIDLEWRCTTRVRARRTTNLKVAGSADDPNRLVDHRGLGYDAMGNPTGSLTVNATDLVRDRIPPIAELTVGGQFQPTPKLSIRATVYDALYAHAYQPDPFFDYEPHLEYLPNPYEGFRAYLSAAYQH
jgi:hypothetical protein